MLDLHEAARIIGIKPTSLKIYARQGIIKAQTNGGLDYFEEGAIEHYIERRKRKARHGGSPHHYSSYRLIKGGLYPQGTPCFGNSSKTVVLKGMNGRKIVLKLAYEKNSQNSSNYPKAEAPAQTALYEPEHRMLSADIGLPQKSNGKEEPKLPFPQAGDEITPVKPQSTRVSSIHAQQKGDGNGHEPEFRNLFRWPQEFLTYLQKWNLKWFRFKTYCELCPEPVGEDDMQVDVRGSRYHFDCYPRTSPPDATHFVSSTKRSNVFRVEYMSSGLSVYFPDWLDVPSLLQFRREHADRRRKFHFEFNKPPYNLALQN